MKQHLYLVIKESVISRQNFPIDALGIIKKNSYNFIEVVFNSYRNQIPIGFLSSLDEANKNSYIEYTEIIEPELNCGWFDQRHDLIFNDNLAQISYTSGTEGDAKAVLLSHNNLSNTVMRLNNIMKVDSSIREYIGVPVYYSFGLARVRACSAVGGASYIPAKGFSPAEIIHMLEKNEINAISAVPTLWRILFLYSEKLDLLGKKVRWIEIGSQYMSREEKETMKSLFPNAQIVQHYGLTEASRSVFLDISNTTGPSLEAVGNIHQNNISLSKDNHIQIKGPQVAQSYIINGSMQSIVNDDGWMVTKDIGAIHDGFLYFKGRSDDMINCGGIKISPEQIEQKIFTYFNINSGSAITRIPDRLRGDGLLVVFEKKSKLPVSGIKTALEEILKEMNIDLGDSLHVWKTEEIPRTETGKVQRKILLEKYNESRSEDNVSTKMGNISDENLTELQKQLVNIWKEVFEVDDISIHSSFYDFGGDSLSSINLILSMEKKGISETIIKDVMQGKTIAQITNYEGIETKNIDKADKTEKHKFIAKTSDAINATRGLMIVLLLFIHWSPGIFERLAFDYERVSNPIFRLGTPGFAIIFGLSVGYFIFHQYSVNSKKARSNIIRAQILLILGITISAVIKFLNLKYNNDGLENISMPSALFYSVLLYYFMAVSTVPIWHRILIKFKNIEIAAILSSLLMFSLNLVFQQILPSSAHLDGFWRLAGLMIEAKYNYFFMTGTVLRD